VRYCSRPLGQCEFEMVGEGQASRVLDVQYAPRRLD
jgi:hypothetical protein